MKLIKTKILSAAVLIASLVGASNLPVMAQDPFSPIVDEKGNISFPNDFRISMVHLGSWFVPEGGASGFHDVYNEKANAEAYRKTGKFPDGTTLVKELRASKSWQLHDWTECELCHG